MRSRRTYLLAVLILLAVSIQSLKGLPWASSWGLDFENLWKFHANCGDAFDPYLVTGAQCGDSLGRDMVYPPLLYWSFAWTRLLPFAAAHAVWVGAILSSIALAYVAFSGSRKRDPALLAIAALSLAQYPTVFALERGNNDALVLALASLSYLAFRTKREGWAGFLLGLTVPLKLYPLFACFVLAAGFLRHSPRALLAGAAGAIVPTLLLIGPSLTYFLRVLPVFSANRNPPGIANHAILPHFPGHEWAAWLLLALLLGAWTRTAFLRLSEDPELVFAGAFAMTTYFSGVSEDYNLLTALPLLFLLASRALSEREGDRKWKSLSFLGFLAVMGHRQAFVGYSPFLQVGWLVAVAVVAALSYRRARS